MTGEVAELESRRRAARARPTRAPIFARGLRFALDSLRGLSKPEIVVVSDGALGDADGSRARASTSVGVELTLRCRSASAGRTSRSRGFRCAAIRSTRRATR